MRIQREVQCGTNACFPSHALTILHFCDIFALQLYSRGEQMKILVVDDEEGARELFNTILTDEGYEVALANSGEDALGLFKSNPYNLVITDIKMPVMDGLQLLQEIRKMGSKTDVIMVTAYGEVESYLKAMSLGAAEYINKPIRIKELKRIVHKVLTEQKARSGG
jgi:two-component system response regulator (stage 0 sporulation protein F)